MRQNNQPESSDEIEPPPLRRARRRLRPRLERRPCRRHVLGSVLGLLGLRHARLRRDQHRRRPVQRPRPGRRREQGRHAGRRLQARRARSTPRPTTSSRPPCRRISQRNGNGNFKPAIEWAFVKAQVTPGLSLRAGRIGAPLFAVSDFRSIGYSNLWLRTPIDVYGQVPFSHFDGADAIYQDTIGSTTLTGQVFDGNTDSRQPTARRCTSRSRSAST